MNLILERRVGESIRIGTDIIVTVLAVQGKRVKIATTAPATVRIERIVPTFERKIK